MASYCRPHRFAGRRFLEHAAQRLPSRQHISDQGQHGTRLRLAAVALFYRCAHRQYDTANHRVSPDDAVFPRSRHWLVRSCRDRPPHRVPYRQHRHPRRDVDPALSAFRETPDLFLKARSAARKTVGCRVHGGSAFCRPSGFGRARELYRGPRSPFDDGIPHGGTPDLRPDAPRGRHGHRLVRRDGSADALDVVESQRDGCLRAGPPVRVLALRRTGHGLAALGTGRRDRRIVLGFRVDDVRSPRCFFRPTIRRGVGCLGLPADPAQAPPVSLFTELHLALPDKTAALCGAGQEPARPRRHGWRRLRPGDAVSRVVPQCPSGDFMSRTNRLGAVPR